MYCLVYLHIYQEKSIQCGEMLMGLTIKCYVNGIDLYLERHVHDLKALQLSKLIFKREHPIGVKEQLLRHHFGLEIIILVGSLMYLCY